LRLAFDLHGVKPDPMGKKFVEVRSRIATIVNDD